MRLIYRLAALAGLCLGLAACATESYSTAENLRRDLRHPRILLMPPDVELYELDAGGSQDLNAQWTEQGSRFLTDAVRTRLTDMQAQFLEFVPPAEDSPEAEKLHQLQKLNTAVGSSIIVFHMIQANRLPAKDGRFDWSLGPEARALGNHADADYALFVSVRDSYSTPGRILLKVVAAAVAGVHVPGGLQLGYASLVDLKTGEVVWFNALHAREAGDLRNAVDAKETVAMLLDKLPK